jgi:hypothetical protein
MGVRPHGRVVLLSGGTAPFPRFVPNLDRYLLGVNRPRLVRFWLMPFEIVPRVSRVWLD